MIYCDNAATTLRKPLGVANALGFALANFGAAGRAGHGASQAAIREVSKTRELISNLVGADGSMFVAFTSSATEALNLVIQGLLEAGDGALATAAEHNSVLRPLHLTGCDLSIIRCCEQGIVDIEHAQELVSKGNVKLLAATHASNVTGSITNVYALRDICDEHGVILLLDVSQTLGVIPVNIDMADILCFTGHKALFGPQGTGGIVLNRKLRDKSLFKIVKTGGTGSYTFEKVQPDNMPDIFESGTLNAHSIYGLQKGIEFINKIGSDAIWKHVYNLTEKFVQRLSTIERVRVYGEGLGRKRLPIVSLNIDGTSAADVAAELWDDHGIAVRAGFHCAPLMHKALGTTSKGVVRFSFSYFNSTDDIDKCIEAIVSISHNELRPS